MGIHGLYDYVNKKVPECCHKAELKDYSGKKLAFDAKGLLYHYVYGNRPGSYLWQYVILVMECVSLGITPVFVWDGKAPEEKREVLEERAKQRQKTQDDLVKLHDLIEEKKNILTAENDRLLAEDIEGEVVDPHREATANSIRMVAAQELSHLEDKMEQKNKIPKVTHEHVIDSMKLLLLLGVPVIQAESEGEATCALMNRLGAVDAVVSDDGDTFAFGAKVVLKGLGAASKRDDGLKHFDTNVFFKGMSMTVESFVEAAILCKCDFAKKIKGLGPVKAFDRIKKLGTVEKVISFFRTHPEELIKGQKEVEKKRLLSLTKEELINEMIPEGFNYEGARRIFYQYLHCKKLPDHLAPENWNQRPFDSEGLVRFFDDRGFAWLSKEVEGWSQVVSGHVTFVPKRLQESTGFGSGYTGLGLEEDNPFGEPTTTSSSKPNSRLNSMVEADEEPLQPVVQTPLVSPRPEDSMKHRFKKQKVLPD